ncbi:beta-class carbonic anhydrase [Aquibacillus rhizosphaerae]|uniref:carbonic anhydrase n=1 Tax=Aquibacillus rhizosphaerae TaxID=3051431 RepID=A0ABT7L3H9_9BACI|nr:carbonic anhydrase [Aquibacillus sp. LR5S19]MDL4840421.1 carbonic anhydrase [Aquibacillus sp. LR5S19]
MYLDELIEYNKAFAKEQKYVPFETDKFPDKRIIIFSCMDTRLVELLPNALNIKNGDAKIVKNAGAIIKNPFGSIMRSLLVAVYELQADEILVIGHHDCGMKGFNGKQLIEKAQQRGVKQDTIKTLEYAGIDVEDWLQGFDSVEESVQHSVNVIRNHPLLPESVPVHGLVIDPNTGQLDVIQKGY